MIGSQRLKLYLTRLKNASLPELMHRIREAILICGLRAYFARGAVNLRIPPVDHGIVANLQLPEFHYSVDEQTLKVFLAGGVVTLNGDGGKIARFEEENRGLFFADVPPADSGYDIRLVWEPARLQHVTVLLLAAHILWGERDVHDLHVAAKTALLNWLKQNPLLSGPHYLSAMEGGLRIPVFFYALKIMPNLAAGDRQKILAAIYEHAWWISRRLSLYSSLGNHTVCECVGLVFAGSIYSSLPEGEAWLNRAIELLNQELFHQILVDGGPVEQSLYYHRFIVDLYWLAVDFLEQNRLHKCTSWKPRLLLAETFLRAFTDNQGKLPAIGDSDDGHAIAPGIYPKRGFGG
jgi:hypothetical protein